GSRSRRITRRCGPEPPTRARSMPASFASRRASGDEKTRFGCAVRIPSSAPSPRGETEAGGAGGAARAGAEERTETPSPIDGGGIAALAGFAGGGAGFRAGAPLPAPPAAPLASPPPPPHPAL